MAYSFYESTIPIELLTKLGSDYCVSTPEYMVSSRKTLAEGMLISSLHFFSNQVVIKIVDASQYRFAKPT